MQSSSSTSAEPESVNKDSDNENPPSDEDVGRYLHYIFNIKPTCGHVGI